MREVVRYVAADGSEWETAEKCSARDKMIAYVENAMAWLKPIPTELNWSGYVQQTEWSYNQCRSRLFEIANTEGVLKWWIDQQKSAGKTVDEICYGVHPSWFGRMLDGGHEPLGRAYHRLCCIDGQLREWNQPYFAMNPDKGEPICRG